MTGANIQRLLVLAGGLSGAGGVALSAAAAHVGGAFVGTVAAMMLAHAPVFVASGISPGWRLLRVGNGVLVLGLLLFCGDLLMRDFAGSPLFPMAAPTGGTLLIAGWLTIAISSAFRPADATGR